MAKRVLITGGAGFIGSHLADDLLSAGYDVRVLDSLTSQVHGTSGEWPDYLHPDVECVHGDVQDSDTVRRALAGVDLVFHFAAAVGVGQSMYEIEKYTSVNNVGTAVLLEALVENPVDRLVVASSMSVYGEGMYRDAHGNLLDSCDRSAEQLQAARWEVEGKDGRPLVPVPTPERKIPTLASVYALSKYDQERMCLMIGRAYDIPVTALRFFNVFGPRQALSNPYTGVLAIFASRYINDRPPLIFEDGLQRRDFVSVYDIVQACRAAAERPEAIGGTFNVGSGQSTTVLEVAALMAKALGKEHLAPRVTQKYRAGDIRHCFADISLAKERLGYRPRFTMEAGLTELAEWLHGQIADDRVDAANAELLRRGLAV